MGAGHRPGRGGLIRLAGLGASAVALGVVIHSVDLAQTGRLLAAADPVPIAACLLVVATQVGLRSVRWRVLLPKPASGTKIPLVRVAPVLLVGYLGNAVLPARLGEPIRAYLVAGRERLDAAEAFGSVVLERIVDTASLAVIVFVAADAVRAPGWIVQAAGAAALVAGAVLAALVTVGLSPFARVGLRLAARLPAADRTLRPATKLADFARGVDRPSRSSAVLVAAVLSVACWALDATTFYLVGRSVGAEISPAMAVLISGVTVLGTAIPSAPGYVGTFDLAAAATGVALGIAGPTALAVGVLAHAVTVLPTAAAGAVSLVAMGARLGSLAKAVEPAGVAATPAAP